MDYRKYMRLALEKAEDALESGEFPVGCVIVAGDKVVAGGCRLNSSGGDRNELDHAEILALREFSQSGISDKRGAVLFCTLEPCLMCYAAIILSGIEKVVYAYEDAMGGGTSVALEGLSPLYSAASVEVVADVMRPESLGLFARFFKNPSNKYWKGSLLEKYTLEQADAL